MKKKITIALLFTGFGIGFSYSQPQTTKDPKAKAILDEMSKKTKSYSSIKADFSYTLKNTEEGINQTQKGSILVKGNMYKINIAGQEIISNGKTVWTYIEDANEVQINNPPDPSEETDVINPSTIFTIYEQGFKYRFMKEENQSGKTVQLINLYPEKAKEKSYHTIRLTIDKAKKQLISINVKSKDGNNYIYKLTTFTPNVKVTDSDFTFSKSKHPDVEVIDLRD